MIDFIQILPTHLEINLWYIINPDDMNVRRYAQTTFSFLLIGIVFLLCATTIYAQVADTIRIYSIFVNRGTDSVTISWKTDPRAKGKVEYADSAGEWKETPWSDTYRSDHSYTLLNLEPNATYLYRITAENIDGEVKTKTGNFTTLDEQAVGVINTGNTGDTSGFRALLSPEPTAVPTVIPGVLGAQNGVLPYYIPIPIAYQPVLQAQANDTLVAPTYAPTAIPTPTEKPSASLLNDTNSTMLIVGIVLGIIVALLLSQLITQKSTAEPREPKIPEMFTKIKDEDLIEDNGLTTFEFNVNSSTE